MDVSLLLLLLSPISVLIVDIINAIHKLHILIMTKRISLIVIDNIAEDWNLEGVMSFQTQFRMRAPMKT